MKKRVKSIEKVLHNYSFIDIEVDLQSKPEPGQFIMIQTTGTSEIHMAIMDYQNGILKIGNKSVGKSTLIGNVKANFFDKNGVHISSLTSDSAYIDQRTNNLRARGNVIVVADNDSLKLFSNSNQL